MAQPTLWCAFVLMAVGMTIGGSSIDFTSCRDNKRYVVQTTPRGYRYVIFCYKECRKIPEVLHEDNDIAKQPKKSPGLNDQGEYVLNITWMPPRIDYCLPKKILLSFELLDKNLAVLDSRCVKLRVDWGKARCDIINGTVSLFYDCIKLKRDEDESKYISVKILSLSRVCGTKKRSKRRIREEDGSCDARCTMKQLFPSHEADYQPEICSMSTVPSISSEIVVMSNGNKAIQVTTGKVPPFTRVVKVMVMNETGGKLVFAAVYPSPKNSTLFVPTNISQIGTYRVIVHYICPGGKFIPVKENTSVIIRGSPVIPVPQMKTDLLLIIGACTLVAIVTVTTCVVFWYRRNVHRPYTVKDLLPPEISRGPLHCRHVLSPIRRKPVVMALCHHDNDYHDTAFKILLKFLKKAGGVRVKYDDWSNIHDFVDGAGEIYMDILVFLSNGLCKSAHEYRDKSSSRNEESDRLFSERLNDITGPVMDVLRNRRRNSSGHCQFVVHLVSFGYKSDTGESLEKLFLGDHFLFLDRSNTLFYEISSLSPGAQSASVSEKHLKALVKYACGVTLHDSDINDFVYGREGLAFLQEVTMAIRQSGSRPDQSETVLNSDNWSLSVQRSILNNYERYQTLYTSEDDEREVETECVTLDDQRLQESSTTSSFEESQL